MECGESMLPNFIIGGERRSGTTSLYYWIKDHSEVFLYPKSDMDFFIEEEVTARREWSLDEPAPDGERWRATHPIEQYEAFFEGAEGFPAVGQKDADLLFWKPAHARLAEYLPNCRYIFCLRDPIERAWSHYWNEVGKKRETLSFEDALAAEPDRIQRSGYARNHLSYFSRGCYVDSLSAFFEKVDRKQVCVVTIEEAKKDPMKVLSQIYTFLGINPKLGKQVSGKAYNQNNTMIVRPWAEKGPIKPFRKVYERLCEAFVVRAYQHSERRQNARKNLQRLFRKPAQGKVMSAKTRKRLQREYAPKTQALSDLLGRSFSEWS